MANARSKSTKVTKPFAKKPKAAAKTVKKSKPNADVKVPRKSRKVSANAESLTNLTKATRVSRSESVDFCPLEIAESPADKSILPVESVVTENLTDALAEFEKRFIENSIEPNVRYFHHQNSSEDFTNRFQPKVQYGYVFHERLDLLYIAVLFLMLSIALVSILLTKP